MQHTLEIIVSLQKDIPNHGWGPYGGAVTAITAINPP